ncbi:conserved hypothetical protein [Pyrenophora tritici-repentis Pt-1C-BFP]|uniref:DUF3723 domain containing protein n=1 Tax=Pyrenophora tritici-repentis (strain Pt-1C-BFP) TaxID=426418 RepID=B2WPJ7_PYRTR|nr:uncharacterized protein PTRG_11948 [Pyrenophora tritici-repentis Pt-1C-BFP]EDU46063.1 conserved hypothetical protein [Pyrenophora tritici-repentis Pt-1C-BFP]
MELPDIDFAATRSTCFRGVARVPLHALNFQNRLVLDKHRELSEENVRRLQNIYEQVGCNRLEEENVINAVIADEDLVAELSSQGKSIEDFCNLQWPQDALDLPLEYVDCLSGMHRIEAARRFLDENDKWWVVRLFSHNTPKPVLAQIIESFANEQKPSDGEVFRKIRLYHRENDEEAQKRWWSRLEKSKPKDLRQLLRRPTLIAGFDALIDMPGLWAKEMALYLDYIAKAWSKILRCGERTLPFSIVDAVTVQNLQLLAPAHSDMDKNLVIELMERRDIFSSLKSGTIRRTLTDNLCAFPGVIPSLWGFFEMLKYLEPLAEALRHLLGKDMKRTIRSSLMGLYFAPSKIMVQTTETQDVEIKVALSRKQAGMIAYTELWAFCGRYFDGLTAFTPRKETGEPKPTVNGPNPVVWQHLARFAVSRGFQIPHAQALVADEGRLRSQLALEYLHKARPTCPTFSDNDVRKVLDAVPVDMDISQHQSPLPLPHLSIDRRIGRPFAGDFAEEKRLLFFPHLYGPVVFENASISLMRRDLFSCIFGSFTFETSDFELVTNSGKPAQDRMDIDTPSEVLGSDTRLTDLESRCSRLQQEYQSLLSQHDTLVRKYEIEHSKTEGLEIENLELQAKCRDLTQKYSAQCEANELETNTASDEIRKDLDNLQNRHHHLEDAYNRVVLEHKDCDATKKQLSSLARQWKAQGDKNLELNSTCARLKRELEEALANRKFEAATVDRGKLLIVVPEPIEATTMSALEDSDTTPTIDQPLYSWVPRTDQSSYEMFFAYCTANGGSALQGWGSLISMQAESALPRIEQLLHQAEMEFGSDQYGAMTILGKIIILTSAEYVFQCFGPTHQTIFIGPNSVLSAYVPVIERRASSSQTGSSVMTIIDAAAQATSKALVKRQRQEDDSEDDEITNDRGFGKELTRYTTKKSVPKRRILRLQGPDVPDMNTESRGHVDSEHSSEQQKLA